MRFLAPIFIALFLCVPALAADRGEKSLLVQAGAEVAPTLPREVIKIVSAGKERAKIDVELAVNPRDQERGLMGRKKLAKDTGMLFVFNDDRLAHFWMRDTLIPLDIVFFDRDGRIVWIHERAKPKDETYIMPPFPVRAALEIRAGAAKAYKITLGDLLLSDTLDRIAASGAD